MPNHPDLDQEQLNDQLAEFVDRVLAPDDVSSLDLGTLDAELRGLGETVLALKRVVGSGLPDPALARRIRSRLVDEWPPYQSHPQPEALGPGKIRRQLVLDRLATSWLARLFTPSRPRKFALGFALVATALLLVVLVISPLSNIPATGAAGGKIFWVPALLILGVALGVIYYWLVRSRH